MKNLFIVKKISENKDISDEAFTVWCGLRNIMRQDTSEYFVSFHLIAHSVFNRVPNRYELNAIKKGYEELVEQEYVKELMEFSKTEHLVDLSALYYEKGQGYFSDLSMEEMHKIMNIDGNHSKYKLLRYFTCQIGSFNRSKGKDSRFGSMGLDYFCTLIPIVKSTCVTFNEILEKNELLFVIRHKDFYRFMGKNGYELREIPNTYSRWKDKEAAQAYAETVHGYKYIEDQKNVKTAAANEKRSLGQKLNRFMSGQKYDTETIRKMYNYAQEKNKVYKKKHSVYYYDLSVFDEYLLDIKQET